MRKPTHKGDQRLAKVRQECPKGGEGSQEGSKGEAMRPKRVRRGGNEIQESLKGEPKGGRRVTNGAGRTPTVSRRSPKGSKRGARGPQGEGRRPLEGQEGGKRDLYK